MIIELIQMEMHDYVTHLLHWRVSVNVVKVLYKLDKIRWKVHFKLFCFVLFFYWEGRGIWYGNSTQVQRRPQCPTN